MAKISLNQQQKKAAETLSGPILVLAGAGAGKTMTLTARIIKLILSGVMPQNILAITFTNKAAGEMKERIKRAIEKNEKINFPSLDYGFIPFVSTFHALGVYIIRENYKEIGVSKYFSIYDRLDMRRAIKEALIILELDSKEWEIKNIISFISKNKGNSSDLNSFLQNGSSNNFYGETMGKIWTEYEKIKKKDMALDFDDLLLETVKLLERQNKIKEHYLRKWTHIHVDEYQDTNKVQYKIIKLLTNKKTENIFVVGDDDQSIYGWRGSDIKNILDFEKQFKSTKKIFMEQNYRSTKNIIRASNFVIEKNKNRYPKKLFSEADSGEKILIYNAFSEREEANYIAKKIKEKIKKISENNIAILYRANFQSRVLEEAMLREGISYQVLGTKFFDRAEVKDIISYIRASKNTESLVDIKRIINSPKRGIGKTSIVKIFSANEGAEISLPAKTAKSYLEFKNILKEIAVFIDKSEKTPFNEVVSYVLDKSGYEKYLKEKDTEENKERLANIYELINFATKYNHMETSEALEVFLEEVALMSDADSDSKNYPGSNSGGKSKNDKKPSVKLMTIHASKGLEFETIFLTGAEDHFFSPQPDLDKVKYKEKLEEERRLFYVAMTRAKKDLIITWASMRNIYGRTETNLVCDFILDIPDEFKEEEGTFSNINQDNDFEEETYLEW